MPLRQDLFTATINKAIDARFRYRIHEGNLAMWYDLIRLEKVKKSALDDI